MSATIELNPPEMLAFNLVDPSVAPKSILTVVNKGNQKIAFKVNPPTYTPSVSDFEDRMLFMFWIRKDQQHSVGYFWLCNIIQIVR
jgi:hypothetical protein